MHLPRIGDTFERRYVLERVLGTGGFATVFLAADTQTGRKVVIKLLSPDPDGSYPAALAARFEREARVFATVECDQIVTMYDFGRTAEGLLFMVFENIDGEDLSYAIAGGPLGPGVTHRVLMQMLEALSAAHRAGILHRDIKPANILLYTYGGDAHRAKLIDFGIAKDNSPDAPRLTQTGRVVGTVRYMAPEQVFGDELTPSTDLFSLGLVAWEMLTGTPAIAGQSQQEMLREHASETPFRLPPQVASPVLRDVVERMLGREPHERFASAEAVLAALRSPGSVAPPPNAPARAATEPFDRRPVIAALVFGAVVLVATVLSLQQPDEPVPTVNVSSRTNVAALLERPATPDENTEEADAEPPPTTSPNCPAEPPFRGLGRLKFSPMGNGMATYIPKNYSADNPPALMLAFHRPLDHGEMFIKASELADEADEQNWVIIAPDAGGIGDFSDNPTQALEAIDLALNHLCIDRSKLHVVGDRNGGTHVQWLACLMPMSSVTSSFMPSTRHLCRPRAPTPHLRLFTTEDRFHKEDGSSCNPLMGTYARWDAFDRGLAEKFDCDAKSTPWEHFGEYCKTLNDCSYAPVVICGFPGGHRWPHGGPPTLAAGECLQDPVTKSPMGKAVAAFVSEYARDLTPEEIAEIDRLRESGAD